MPYFIIIPAFAAWLVLSVITVLVCRFWAPAKVLFPYVWRICLWSDLGFLVANAIFWGLILMGLHFLREIQSGAHEAVSLITAGTLFIGPFIASALGWLAGFLAGIILACSAQEVQAFAQPD